MPDIVELCQEIQKRAYAMLHQSPLTAPESAEVMLTKIYSFAEEIKAEAIAQGWSIQGEEFAQKAYVHMTAHWTDDRVLQMMKDGEIDKSDCQHQDHEDCMNCAVCGRCREDLDSNDVCMDCGGIDET